MFMYTYLSNTLRTYIYIYIYMYVRVFIYIYIYIYACHGVVPVMRHHLRSTLDLVRFVSLLLVYWRRLVCLIGPVAHALLIQLASLLEGSDRFAHAYRTVGSDLVPLLFCSNLISIICPIPLLTLHPTNIA